MIDSFLLKISFPKKFGLNVISVKNKNQGKNAFIVNNLFVIIALG